MKTQIPIYRAKKIDSDEWIDGSYISDFFDVESNKYIGEVIYKLTSTIGKDYFQIDQSTLAIHFPDMIDSDGNKIFASLSEDGKGGDIVSGGFGIPRIKVEQTVIYKNGSFIIETKKHNPKFIDIISGVYHLDLEIIGIQQ